MVAYLCVRAMVWCGVLRCAVVWCSAYNPTDVESVTNMLRRCMAACWCDTVLYCVSPARLLDWFYTFWMCVLRAGIELCVRLLPLDEIW